MCNNLLLLSHFIAVARQEVHISALPPPIPLFSPLAEIIGFSPPLNALPLPNAPPFHSYRLLSSHRGRMFEPPPEKSCLEEKEEKKRRNIVGEDLERRREGLRAR